MHYDLEIGMSVSSADLQESNVGANGNPIPKIAHRSINSFRVIACFLKRAMPNYIVTVLEYL
jgi:hypothetical protein